MSRPLRIEYKGGVYHVTSRGNARQVIYADDIDRHHFLALLEKDRALLSIFSKESFPFFPVLSDSLPMVFRTLMVPLLSIFSVNFIVPVLSDIAPLFQDQPTLHG